MAYYEGEAGRDMEGTRVAMHWWLLRVGVEYIRVHCASFSTFVYFEIFHLKEFKIWYLLKQVVSSLKVGPQFILSYLYFSQSTNTYMNILQVLLAEAETGSPGRTAYRKVYLVMLQVPLGVCPYVPYFTLCVVQLFLHKLEFLVHAEACYTF